MGSSSIVPASLIEGSEADRREARESHRRMQRLAVCESAKWERLDLNDLEFERFSVVVHRPTGRRYRIAYGDLLDAAYSNVSAWFISRGEAVTLERIK